MVDRLPELEDKIMLIDKWEDKYNTLGVVEHGMPLKFMNELGRSCVSSVASVLSNIKHLLIEY